MPEVCGDRELFSPSVSCADSSLVRGSKKGAAPEGRRDREPFSPPVGCADSSLVRGSGKSRTQT